MDQETKMQPLKARLAVLAPVFGIPLALAQQGPPALLLHADGEIQIAKDGGVRDYKPRVALSAPVAALIDKSIRGWHFEPVVVGGVPVIASTAVHLDLSAEPIKGSNELTLRIASVHFGEPQRLGVLTPPLYPREATRVGLDARVVLFLQLDESGKVIKAQTYQTSLGARARSEAEAEGWRRLFERASIAAAMNWQYKLSEKVDGKPIGTSVLAPVEFSMLHSDGRAHWAEFVPGPVHTGLWAGQLAQSDEHSLAEASDGNALSIDSRFRLTDDVVGKTL
ncbi:MAG: energy transducer TonB [Dokdonella sp.]